MKSTRKKEWFDDDSFWRELYPFMFSEQRIDAADEQVADALALIKPSGKSVLDLCCGPGPGDSRSFGASRLYRCEALRKS
jgi:hypothetical protein